MFLEQWHWWTLCLIFVTLAGVVRGSLMLWLTLASGVLGGVSWVQPETPAMYQLMLFALITMGGMALGELFTKQKPAEVEAPPAPEDRRLSGDRFIDKVYVLETPIVNGTGNIVIEGQVWRVRGENAQVGEEIRVVAADGIERDLLIVERADAVRY